MRELLGKITAREPHHQLADRSGQRQRIWAVRDADELAAIREAVAPCRPLLADGHHRYAAYHRLQARSPGTGWDHGLAMLVDQEDTPLFLGAIHRVVEGIALDGLLEGARTAGSAPRLLSRRRALDALAPDTLVLTDQDRWAVVPVPEETLAVDFLHATLLRRGGDRVTYHHALDGTLRHARPDKVAAIMPALGYDDVGAILARGHLLPEKATSFQPKPTVGALMRAARDESRVR